MAETTELKKSDFYFDLPQELIAQDPLEDRSSSRLLVLDKNTGELSHHIFRDIIDYLHPGDCLVLNNTTVIPTTQIRARTRTRGPDKQGYSGETFRRAGRYRRTCGSSFVKKKRSGCLGDVGKARQKMQARSAPDLRRRTVKGGSA